MNNNNQNIFRKKTLERISSPEQLTDYLRVTSPGIWVVLASVILLLAGMFAWAAVGTLETTAAATVIVSDRTASIVTTGGFFAGLVERQRLDQGDHAAVR